jgi:hypothetical protein
VEKPIKVNNILANHRAMDCHPLSVRRALHAPAIKRLQRRSPWGIRMPERIAQYCKVHLNLQNAELSEEYYYRSLPFCIRGIEENGRHN